MADKNLKHDDESKNKEVKEDNAIIDDKNLKHDDDKRNNELAEDCLGDEGVNCIVVKPIIKIDVNISGLRTGNIVG